MALIGDNFIFIHVYKCGGMSIRKAFAGHNTVETGKSHCTISQLAKELDESGRAELISSRYKFAFVRNPFDWMVSLYEFCKKHEGHELHEKTKHGFSEFLLKYVTEDLDHTVTPNGLITTLTGFLYSNGKCMVDFVGRLENFNHDFIKVLQATGITIDEIPYENKRDNKAEGYRKYYGHEDKMLVEKYFYNDLECFQYQF